MSWAEAFGAQRESLERGPQAAPPATFGEIVASNWDAAGLHELTGAAQPWAQAEDDLRRGVESAAGMGVTDLAQSRGIRLEALGWAGSTAEARAGELQRLALDLQPEAQEALKPLLDVAGNARRIRADRERKAADVSARTYGFADNALAFAVGMGRSMVEPVNIASMAVGNPFAGKLLMMLGREAGLGMAVQAVQEPIIAAERYQLGAEVTFGESLGNIAMAGLGNAVGAGMLRAGAWALRGFRRAGEVLPAGEHADPVMGAREDRAADLDAAARFAEREELLGAMAPDPSPAGRAIHAEALEISLTALEDGRAGLFARIEAETDLALRRVDPELFAAIDDLDARRAGLRAELDRVTGEGAPATRQALEPRIAALEAELEGITGKRRSSPRAERLRQEIAGLREAQGSLGAEASARARDTEIALRLNLSDLDMQRARLGPQVHAARAAAGVADAPELKALRAELDRLDTLKGEAEAVVARLAETGLDGARVSGMGPHGPVIAGLEGKWREAVTALQLLEEGEAKGVLAHPDVPGPIDLVWGNRQGGLSHILAKHPEVVADLPARLATMVPVQKSESHIRLAGPDGQAGVRLDWDGAAKSWLVTAYDPKAARVVKDRRSEGTSRRSGIQDDAGSSPSPVAASIAPGEPKGEIARRQARHADVERALAERGGDLDLVLSGETVSARQLLDDIQADATAAKALKDCLGAGGPSA